MRPEYDQEMIQQFMNEEAEKTAAEEKKKELAAKKKTKADLEKAVSGAQLAFSQTQSNRYEIDQLRKQLKRTRIIAIIAIVLSLVCMSMTMLDELNQMSVMLP